MSWRANSGNEYRLCLLDTNALSSIVKHPKSAGRAFLERFPPSEWAPCWTVYNVIELREARRVYERWLAFFGVYPSFILQPWQTVVEREVLAYDNGPPDPPLMRSFSPDSDNHELGGFVAQLFQQDWMRQLEASWGQEEAETLAAWQSTVSDSRVASEYVSQECAATLALLHPEWSHRLFRHRALPDIDRFPGLQTMVYSQYYRVHDSNRRCEPNDVTDVRIMAVAPYMEAIVTEKFQAEVFRRIAGSVAGIDRLDVIKVGELLNS